MGESRELLRFLFWVATGRGAEHLTSLPGSPAWKPPPFQYRGRLKYDLDIRLLELLPGQYGSPIESLLHDYNHVDGIEDPNKRILYDALSYTWGGPQKTEYILCNNEKMMITKNLHDSLAHLRLEERSRFIWTDAICINQGDNKEKAHQLMLMYHTYATAIKTMVWLGDGNEESQLAFKTMKELIKRLSKLENSDQVQVEELQRFGIPTSPDNRHWKALRRFFTRPWFSRKWVIQEFAFGREVRIMCGKTEIDGSILEEFMSLMMKHGVHKLRCGSEGKSLFAVDKIPFYNVLMLRRMVRATLADRGAAIREYSHLSLMEILYRTWYAQVSVPHDAIYSILDMCGRLGEYSGTFIDYDQPCAETFRIWTIRQDWSKERLHLLQLAGQMKKIKYLPSWVPDWSYFPPRTPLMHGSHTLHYNASKTSEKPVFRFDGAGRVLYVSGYIIDTIQAVSKPTWKEHETSAQKQEIICTTTLAASIHNLETLTSQITQYPTREDIQTVRWKTLTGNRESNSHAVAPEIFARIYNHFHRSVKASAIASSTESKDADRSQAAAVVVLIEGEEKALDSTNTITHQKGEDEKEIKPEDIRVLISSFIAAASEIGQARKFCLTERGYVGQIPSETQLGDRICIFVGECTPFVVRGVEEEGCSWELVGDAYVHGIMEGEGLDLSSGVGGPVEIALV